MRFLPENYCNRYEYTSEHVRILIWLEPIVSVAIVFKVFYKHFKYCYVMSHYINIIYVLPDIYIKINKIINDKAPIYKAKFPSDRSSFHRQTMTL